MPTVTANVEVQAEIDVEIYCATCGDGLCNQSQFVETRNRYQPSIRVEVCESCIKSAKREAYEEGYEKARAEFEDVSGV